jgi:hypothetical protein
VAVFPAEESSTASGSRVFVPRDRALGATKPDTAHPNPVEHFLATHPHAKEFLESRTYPVSYAQAKYFGINSVKAR